MNDPIKRHYNALAAAMILGFVPKDFKGKKSRTKVQQKKRRSATRDSLAALFGECSWRQISRRKFIVVNSRSEAVLWDAKHNFTRVINKDSKIGRKYAR